MHVIYNLKINKGKIWIETKQNIVKSKIKKVQNWKRKKNYRTNKQTKKQKLRQWYTDFHVLRKNSLKVAMIRALKIQPNNLEINNKNVTKICSTYINVYIFYITSHNFK